ncbi:MAG: thiol-disulfide oxidoreductase DCC family protein [Flavisolibacter sp.]|nr:thiol-disulfide oxidoreductase DCC family protein [Flavisolibacter sp.]
MNDLSAIDTTNPIILFDGVCNFCNGMVLFIIKQDKQKVFRFAALQSEAGQRLLKTYQLPRNDFDSFLLIENGKVYRSSTAGLRLYNKLPWYWMWMQVFWIVPKIFRDAVYDFIARNRYKWFGKKETCMIPTPDVRSRFLV